MENEAEKPVVFSLRIPPNLYAALRATAERNERSINSEILHTLKTSGMNTVA